MSLHSPCCLLRGRGGHLALSPAPPCCSCLPVICQVGHPALPASLHPSPSRVLPTRYPALAAHGPTATVVSGCARAPQGCRALTCSQLCPDTLPEAALLRRAPHGWSTRRTGSQLCVPSRCAPSSVLLLSWGLSPGLHSWPPPPISALPCNSPARGTLGTSSRGGGAAEDATQTHSRPEEQVSAGPRVTVPSPQAPRPRPLPAAPSSCRKANLGLWLSTLVLSPGFPPRSGQDSGFTPAPDSETQV